MGVRWVFKLIPSAQNLIGRDIEPIKLKTFASDSLESFQIKNVPSSIRNITLIIYDGLDATNPSPIPIRFSQPIRNELVRSYDSCLIGGQINSNNGVRACQKRV